MDTRKTFTLPKQNKTWKVTFRAMTGTTTFDVVATSKQGVVAWVKRNAGAGIILSII